MIHIDLVVLVTVWIDVLILNCLLLVATSILCSRLAARRILGIDLLISGNLIEIINFLGLLLALLTIILAVTSPLVAFLPFLFDLNKLIPVVLLIDLLVFQDFCENEASHVGVVARFMVVGRQVRTRVIQEPRIK